MLVFDLEADGLLDTLTKIHCLHIGDSATGIITRYDKQDVASGLKALEEADAICGHNIIGYDIPALQKVFKKFKPAGKVYDTLLWARLAYPDLSTVDIGSIKSGRLPPNMRGRYSLKAFGYRLGVLKGDFNDESTDWSEWTQGMSDYCVQDVEVTLALLSKLQSKEIATDPLELEMKVAQIIQLQVENGFGFDRAKAIKLYSTLAARREEIKEILVQVFPPFYLPDGRHEFTPKKDNQTKGYVANCPSRKIKLVEFNPASTMHIIHNLKRRYGWVPSEFTDKGTPKMDEEVMSKLPYKEAKILCEYMMIKMRLGQLAEGDNAWLKSLGDGDIIHGSVNSCGAVTRRMTHSNPNVAQVPANGKPFGEDCRELFRPTKRGWVQVGGDASGLEVRCLAHYMAAFDQGAYAQIVLEGDIHTVNQKAAGLVTRGEAKTFIYAYLYGCGDLLLGQIVAGENAYKHTEGKLRKMGKKLRSQFQENLPALGNLVKRVKLKVEKSGTLISLDGSVLKSRSSHSALNLLLQSCGAILMKRALVILFEDILTEEFKWTHGKDYAFMANVHDEFQMECPIEYSDQLGEAITRSIRLAGEYYKFRIPLDGAYKVGASWKDCH